MNCYHLFLIHSLTTPRDGVIIDVNGTFLKDMEYEREEVIGKTTVELGIFDDPNDRQKLVSILESKGMAFGYECRFRSKYGKIMIGLLSIVYIKLKGNICQLSTVIDITEHKNAEFKLREVLSEAMHFREALDRVSAFVYMKDPNSHYVYANHSTLELFGCSAEELIGCDDTRFFPRDVAKKLREVDARVFRGEHTSEEIEVTDKDGRRCIYWEVKTPIYTGADNNTIWGLLGISTDITERKHAEEELTRAKEKAEELSKFKSLLLANMSHELRTPLISILGFSELIQEEAVDDSVKDMAKYIMNGGNRLLDTLNNLLQFSQIESKKLKPHFEKIDINQFVKELLDGLASRVKEKGLRLKTEYELIPFYGYLDKSFLKDIFINLLGNAIKFTDKGMINVITKIDSEFFYIKIADTGRGISPNHQRIIFDEFRQASEGLGRRYEGTGLGLSIANRLANIMNGEILVESKVNFGSVFTIKFPYPHLDMDSGEQVQIPDTLTKSSSLPNLLYVEDDLITFSVIKLFLQDICNVENAENSDVASTKIISTAYDLFLMDIHLGGETDGKEVTKFIRKLPQYKETPIIALTAYALHENSEECLAAGCSCYLAKPFRKQELIDLVLKVLKN